MTKVQQLADELWQCVKGDPWYGPPLFSVIQGVNHTMAGRKPIKDAHSIWELVLHITAWMNTVNRRINGIQTDQPLAGDFPPVDKLYSEAWQTELRVLIEEFSALHSGILKLKTRDLKKIVPGSEDTYYTQIHGIIQHTIYHTGQIAILKKALMK
jgi:hypothetical protein